MGLGWPRAGAGAGVVLCTCARCWSCMLSICPFQSDACLKERFCDFLLIVRRLSAKSSPELSPHMSAPLLSEERPLPSSSTLRAYALDWLFSAALLARCIAPRPERGSLGLPLLRGGGCRSSTSDSSSAECPSALLGGRRCVAAYCPCQSCAAASCPCRSCVATYCPYRNRVAALYPSRRCVAASYPCQSCATASCLCQSCVAASSHC